MNFLKANKTQIPFKLQFFGEGEPTPEPNPNLKTYSHEEYAKLKASFDKTSSELASLKKQIMTDEEKKAEEDKALREKVANYESQLENLTLEKSLTKNNLFSSEEAQNILKSKDNKSEMLESIMTLVSAKIEQAKKNAIAEFMQSSNVTGGVKTPNSVDDEIIAMAKRASKTTQKSNFF
nr:MAG TPA: Major head protein [Caudoviricetes sp.]